MTLVILAVVIIAGLLTALALREADLEANYTLPLSDHRSPSRDLRR
jgi:hypothetical protein